MKKLLSVFIGIIAFHFLSAQDTSHLGTEFWVGYGHHQFMETGTNSQQMTIYISSGPQPATVTVTIDSSGIASLPNTWWRRTYNIPANMTISVEDDFAFTYSTSAGSVGEMPKGVNSSYDARLYTDPPPLGSGSTGVFRRRGIRIQSNVPVTAHSHIYGSAASGATTLLPTRAWGYTYTAINSKQSYASNCFSWLYVIAKQDSTVIEITPSILTRAQNLTGLQPGVAKTFLLQKGQIYQILGANDGADANGNGGTSESGKELTGTKVRALVKGRPVAVFCGSSRTSNPATCGSGGGDNDMVQSFPLHTWGKHFITAPTSGGTATKMATNTYKIAVSDPTTIVKRNGIVLTTLLPTGYYMYESSTPDVIEADQPIMVAQFLTGGSVCGYGGTGDPDMYYLTPVEAGVKTTLSYRTTNEGISTHFLTLVIPTAGLPSLRIDTSAVFDSAYQHPQAPGYTVVVKRWLAAKKRVLVEADTAFTGIVYGLGSVESFGYNIGRNLNAINNADQLARFIWRGTVNSDWNNPANWDTGLVPSGNDNVQVPAGTIYSLIVTSGMEVYCQSLTIDPSAVVTVETGAILNVRK